MFITYMFYCKIINGMTILTVKRYAIIKQIRLKTIGNCRQKNHFIKNISSLLSHLDEFFKTAFVVFK